MTSIIDQTVELIQRNRISTTEVADALGKRYVRPGLMPIVQDLHVVGPIFPVFAANGSNHDVHCQLEHTPADCVVVVFVESCGDQAILGDIIAKYVLLYRGARALIIEGLVRDAARLRRERYAIWSHGVSPLGCVNTPAAPFDADRRLQLEKDYTDGIAVCDDGGVVLIPADRVTTELQERLARIELQEDLWSFCLNTLKWSTKDIVCEKRYFKEPEVLPAHFREQLELLKRGFER